MFKVLYFCSTICFEFVDLICFCLQHVLSLFPFLFEILPFILLCGWLIKSIQKIFVHYKFLYFLLKCALNSFGN